MYAVISAMSSSTEKMRLSREEDCFV